MIRRGKFYCPELKTFEEQKAIERYNIKREEVAVLGDGMNDYSMFKEFPCSFAMEKR